MKSNLAIVIPAYKALFLEQTLDSLVQQTSKEFVVYIGDDNSPYHLDQIVQKYVGQLNIVYRRFNQNLGGQNLIAQWERCVRLIGDEEYFCLFSDDDLLGTDNVKLLMQTLEDTDREYDVYHYNIDIIDENNRLLKACNDYPPVLSSEDFLYLLYTNQIDARMPEFVFKTATFWAKGGFVYFDLAYTSDNATVVVCAGEKGIYSVQGGKVLWRDSGVNVSSDKDILLMRRRFSAFIDFLNWIEVYYQNLDKVCPLTKDRRLKLILRELVQLSPVVNRDELFVNLKKLNLFTNNSMMYWYCRLRLALRLYKLQKKGSK